MAAHLLWNIADEHAIGQLQDDKVGCCGNVLRSGGGGPWKEGKLGSTSHTQAMGYTTPVRGWYNKARVAASVTRVRA